jgi:hypothetical protein
MKTFDQIREEAKSLDEASATAGDHEDAAHAHRTASKQPKQDLKAVKAHEKAAEHHDTAAKHLRNGNAYAAQNAHINAKNEADKAKDHGNVHSKRAHADTRAIGEGFVSAAQRKAVWASKADGGKGHPDNKKEAKSADVKPEKYTDANGKIKIRMVPVVKEQDEVNELDTSTLVSYRKKANKQRYSNNISKRTQRTAGVDAADKKLRKRNIDKFGDHSPKGVDKMGNRKEDYTPAQKAAKEKGRIGPKGEVGKREYGSDKSKRGFHKAQRGVSGKGDNRNTMSIFDRQPKTALQGNKPKGKLPEDSDAVKAFLAKGGKIKKLPPAKAQGYHGKDDPGKGMHGMMDRPDTKAMGTRKKVKSMAAESVDYHNKMANAHDHHGNSHESEVTNGGHDDHDYAGGDHHEASAAHKAAAAAHKKHGGDSSQYKSAAAKAKSASSDAKDASSELKFKKTAAPKPIRDMHPTLKSEAVKPTKAMHVFDNEKDARAKAKDIDGKYVKGTGKSDGKHAAIKEISQDTKKSYIKKAADDMSKQADRMARAQRGDGKMDKAVNKFVNRRKGIARAVEAKETDPPFDNAKKISTTPTKDQFGNVIKNRAKSLAKAAAKTAGGDMGDKPKKESLWDNIRKRRAAGKPKLKPGDKNYPKTLKIGEETVNELDQSTMNSYHSKAQKSKDRATNSAVATILRKGDHSKDLKTMSKREKGMKLAKSRTIRKMRNEESQELAELSPELLTRYTKKAIPRQFKAQDRARDYGVRGTAKGDKLQHTADKRKKGIDSVRKRSNPNDKGQSKTGRASRPHGGMRPGKGTSYTQKPAGGFNSKYLDQ